jgi:hypothetical protein
MRRYQGQEEHDGFDYDVDITSGHFVCLKWGAMFETVNIRQIPEC